MVISRLALDYPIYGIDYDPVRRLIVAVGGGGPGRSGVKNKITLVKLSDSGDTAAIVGSLDTRQEAPMTAAFAPDASLIAVGVNDRCWLVRVVVADSKGKRRKKDADSVTLSLQRAFQTENIITIHDGIARESPNYQRATAWSPDSRYLVTGGEGGTGILWDYRSKRHWNINNNDNNDGPICDLDSKGGGSLLIVCPKAITVLRIASVVASNGKALERRIQPEGDFEFRCGRFIADDSMLVGCQIQRKLKESQISLWKLNNTNDLLAIFPSPKGRIITCLAVADDPQLVAYGCSDGTVGVLSCHPNGFVSLLLLPQLHQFAVTSVALDPVRRLLISASADSTIRVARIRPARKSFIGQAAVLLLLAMAILALAVFLLMTNSKND